MNSRPIATDGDIILSICDAPDGGPGVVAVLAMDGILIIAGDPKPDDVEALASLIMKITGQANIDRIIDLENTIAELEELAKGGPP